LPEARCPECGATFDPGDPTTFNPTGKPIGRACRFIVAAPVWPVLLVSIAAQAWFFWSLQEPHVIMGMGDAFGLLLAALFVATLPILLRSSQLLLRFAVSDGGKDRFLRRLHSRWPAWPFVLLVTVLPLVLPRMVPQPTTLAFRLYRADLDLLADRALAKPSTATSLAPCEVGCFQIESIEVRNREVILYTKVIDEYRKWGFVRHPDCREDWTRLDPSVDRSNPCMRRLKDDWYILYVSGPS
jgi:hypothetical protein